MKRIGLALLALALLSGCAGPFTGICGVQPIGEDERGIAYFRYYCGPA